MTAPCQDDCHVCEVEHEWRVTATLGGHVWTHRLDSHACPDPEGGESLDASMEAIAYILDHAAKNTSGPWARGYIELTCDKVIIRTMEAKS